MPADRSPPPNQIIVSFEDYSLRIFDHRIDRRILGELRPDVTVFNLLVLRNPFNLLASRRRAGMLTRRSAHYCGLSLPALYAEYAREYRGQTKHLSMGKTVPISYDRWHLDSSYRRALAAALELPFSDRNLNIVSGQGGGSSFDGTAIPGQELHTGDRWIDYRNSDLFAEILRNEEIVRFVLEEFHEHSDLANWLSTQTPLREPARRRASTGILRQVYSDLVLRTRSLGLQRLFGR